MSANDYYSQGYGSREQYNPNQNQQPYQGEQQQQGGDGERGLLATVGGALAGGYVSLKWSDFISIGLLPLEVCDRLDLWTPFILLPDLDQIGNQWSPQSNRIKIHHIGLEN